MAFKDLVGRLCLFSILCSAIIAAPVAELIDELHVRPNETVLVKRASGTQNDPFDAYFDITGLPNIAEENCYVMLCLLNGNRVFQRNPGAASAKKNRQSSGAKDQPFIKANLKNRKTSQINPNTVSAEEFPWASTREGGSSAFLLPATVAEQNKQKSSISAGYSKHTPSAPNGINWNEYFRINFEPGPFGTYCTALFANTPDTTVCQNTRTTTLFSTNAILSNYVYSRVNKAKNYYFNHAAGVNKGKSTKRSDDFDTLLAEETDDEPNSF